MNVSPIGSAMTAPIAQKPASAPAPAPAPAPAAAPANDGDADDKGAAPVSGQFAAALTDLKLGG